MKEFDKAVKDIETHLDCAVQAAKQLYRSDKSVSLCEAIADAESALNAVKLIEVKTCRHGMLK